MGPLVLAMIKKASEKLIRSDPEYAARMKANRLAHRREITAAIAREFDQDYQRFIKSNNAADITKAEPSQIQDRSESVVDTVNASWHDPKKPNKKTSAPKVMQPKNPTKSIKTYTFNGEAKTLTEWVVATGINRSTIKNRLSRGWSLEAALTIATGITAGWQTAKNPKIVEVKAARHGGGPRLPQTPSGPANLVHATVHPNREFFSD